MRLRLSPAEGQQRIVLSEQGLRDLSQALTEAAEDNACRVIVLEGQDGVFCEGMDLAWITSQAQPIGHAATEAMTQFADCLAQLATARQYTIALIDGAVRAGGIGIVAACDLILATESSEFGLPEVMLGLVPAMVLPLLQARVGFHHARKWAMTGTSLHAQRAHDIGFVDELTPDSAALTKAYKRWMRQMLRMEPDAVATCKRVCQDMQTMPLADALQHGAQTTGGMLQDPARLQAIRDFLEGEPLPWFARYRPPSPPSE